MGNDDYTQAGNLFRLHWPGVDRLLSLPKEYLAESIIKAHRVVAAPGYTVKEGKASMSNYNHFMTIQEVIDIVAFLKHGVGKR